MFLLLKNKITPESEEMYSVVKSGQYISIHFLVKKNQIFEKNPRDIHNKFTSCQSFLNHQAVLFCSPGNVYKMHRQVLAQLNKAQELIDLSHHNHRRAHLLRAIEHL